MNKKYSFSTNEENYHGEYSTPEEAAQEAFGADDECLRVYVGEIVKPRLEDYVCARNILEDITTNNEEQFGNDWAENWLDTLFESKDAIAELDEQMTALVKAWVEKHGFQPTFWNVENVKEYTREQILGNTP